MHVMLAAQNQYYGTVKQIVILHLFLLKRTHQQKINNQNMKKYKGSSMNVMKVLVS